ncbi:MAG: hypothetical protein E7812_19005 [Phenylobacterium sp.]|nr:MAG: hypothetical protein E7812_19005 [Phenylobacterium sp.]
MTVRESKRFILAGGALIAGALIASAILTIRRGGGLHEIVQLTPPALMVVVLASSWRRLSQLEAEHGPDYEQPSTPGRVWLIVLALALVAVLAGVLAYVLVARR